MAKLQTAPKTQIERIRAVHPPYADLLQKSAELHARHEEVLAEIRPLAEQGRRAAVSWVSQSPRQKAKPIVRHAGATALLGDLLPPQTPEEIDLPEPRPSWPGENQLRQLGEESEAINEAIKLLAPEISRARKEYSKQVAAQRGAEYQSIVERVVDAAKALGDAALAHHEFIDTQRRDSVSWSHFRPIDLSAFGDVDANHSPLKSLIIAAADQGHISQDRIPNWRMPAELARLQNGGR